MFDEDHTDRQTPPVKGQAHAAAFSAERQILLAVSLVFEPAWSSVWVKMDPLIFASCGALFAYEEPYNRGRRKIDDGCQDFATLTLVFGNFLPHQRHLLLAHRLEVGRSVHSRILREQQIFGTSSRNARGHTGRGRSQYDE
jgi:hypothetical protein